jgi:hypothetical protein
MFLVVVAFLNTIWFSFLFSFLLLILRKVIRRPYRRVATRWNSDHKEVRATNIFMGDLQRSLVIMLGENGCDVHLLQDADGDPVDRMTMMFSPTEQTILWQYECGSEPVVLLSKFFQLDVPTSHLVLVHLQARIEQLREPKFAMFADILHNPLEVLTGRNKTETVLSDEVTDCDDHGRVEAMHRCVAKFRSVFADNLAVRCGLVIKDNDKVLVPVKDLPQDIGISCLLHPLVGGKNVWGVMHCLQNQSLTPVFFTIWCRYITTSKL